MALIQVMIQRRRKRVKDKFRSAPPKNTERKQILIKQYKDLKSAL